MNYYEELGIRSDADEEEIRKAHRRLVKLMHPDQHRDQSLKQLAETQMRRLNSIVATLLDPEERRDYDEQLRGGSDSPAAMSHQSAWRSVPWWIASTLGAIVLTVGAIWFFADRLNSGFRGAPAVIEEPSTTAPQPVRREQPSDSTKVTVPVPGPLPAIPPPSPSLAHPSGEGATVAQTPIPVPVPEKSKPLPANPAAGFPPAPATAPVLTATNKPSKATAPPVVAPKKIVTASQNTVSKRGEVSKTIERAAKHQNKPATMAASIPAKIMSAPKRLADVPVITATAGKPETEASLGPAPAVGFTPPMNAGDRTPLHVDVPPPAMALTGRRDPLEGEWVYAPTEPEKARPGLYPPEFIELKLRKDGSGMHGEYSARYNIADNRPVSPEVNFSLKAVDDKALKYVWTSADGSHGWFVIRALEPDTMRLEWKTTSNRSGPALSSGVATLVRKN
jgi:hypothetical protein